MSENDELSGGDAGAIAEAIVDVLVERGLIVDAGLSGARVLNVNKVALLLGRNRAWVYDHAAELGAFRFGDGPEARLGFDALDIERWKRERRIRPREPEPRRRGSRSFGMTKDIPLIPFEPLPPNMRPC
jgi:hypothetical protein